MLVFGTDIHDSVDADNGVIDGSGLNGDSWVFGSGAADERRLELMKAGDHREILRTMDAYMPFAPEGRFGHYIMMVAALGGEDCTARRALLGLRERDRNGPGPRVVRASRGRVDVEDPVRLFCRDALPTRALNQKGGHWDGVDS